MSAVLKERPAADRITAEHASNAAHAAIPDLGSLTLLKDLTAAWRGRRMRWSPAASRARGASPIPQACSLSWPTPKP